MVYRKSLDREIILQKLPWKDDSEDMQMLYPEFLIQYLRHSAAKEDTLTLQDWLLQAILVLSCNFL